MSALHTCPAPGCQRQVSPSYLMCRAHWSLVPTDLARQVYRTWFAYQRADRHVIGYAARRYQAAVDQAIAALPSRPPQSP